MHPPSADTCEPFHDRVAFTVSALVSLGLVLSYAPQHVRIIYNRSSEGIDPTFLLLGSTSSASSLLNILALSWTAVRCCPFLTKSACLESMMGILQIFLQWACFNLVFILFLLYYPQDNKYVNWVRGEAPPYKSSKAWRRFKRFFTPANFAGSSSIDTALDSPTSEDSFDFNASMYSPAGVQRRGGASTMPDEVDDEDRRRGADRNAIKTTVSPEWRTSTNYAILAALHLVICGFVTFLLLLVLPKASQPPVHPNPDPTPGPHEENRDVRVVRIWATTLGLLSTVLALFQYLPQIMRTWRRKLVGSLSIPMMCIQTPGSFVFVYSLFVRPGVNWTAWSVYLITGILQGFLLVMCIVWTIRQKRLGIDAYGKPIAQSSRGVPDERRPLLR